MEPGSRQKLSTGLSCPVCGYYCLGNGGIGCIDKPSIVENEAKMKPFINGVECTALLENRMQCIRTATRRKLLDKENKTAICDVCWRLAGTPAGYECIPPPEQVDASVNQDPNRENRA